MGINPVCECHGHIFMDGLDYKSAKARHEKAVDENAVRTHLSALQGAGVAYFRDGGDPLGVSLYARTLAREYGIVYKTPAFAIYPKGRYGSVVGRGYSSWAEYESLLTQLQGEKADFVKIMLSGIITFRWYGELSCPSLPSADIATLVRLAHERGFSVMAHGNGEEAVSAAIEAGVDSVEHGVFLSEQCLCAMAERKTLWVPTLSAISAFAHRGGYDNSVALATLCFQQERVRKALEMGVLVCSGSDSGAWGVPHGAGIQKELTLLGCDCHEGNKALRERF